MTWDGLGDLEGDLRASPRPTAVLTGAGVSVASGVPSFRGNSGIWTRYDPAEYATIEAFDRDPVRVWGLLRELATTLAEARPNEVHRAIAALETSGYVEAVLTQNVDGLHQSAGSQRVIELHGGHRTLTCRGCGANYDAEEVSLPPPGDAPRCDECGVVLKPDVVLFGEPLPARAMREAEHVVRHCGVLLVVGTSAEVYPVAGLPDLASRHRAAVWEVNPEPAVRGARAIAGPAEDVLPELADRLVQPGHRAGRRQRHGWSLVRRLFGGDRS